MNKENSRKAFAVLVGINDPNYICELETTAIRMANHADVQGTDGRVVEVEIFNYGNFIYGPIGLRYPTVMDTKNQEVLNARRAIINKMKAAGITEEEIEALKESFKRIT